MRDKVFKSTLFANIVSAKVRESWRVCRRASVAGRKIWPACLRHQNPDGRLAEVILTA